MRSYKLSVRLAFRLGRGKEYAVEHVAKFSRRLQAEPEARRYDGIGPNLAVPAGRELRGHQRQDPDAINDLRKPNRIDERDVYPMGITTPPIVNGFEHVGYGVVARHQLPPESAYSQEATVGLAPARVNSGIGGA